MAERRMFAKTIVLSDTFLDMPVSARCLYFTLGMLADDDGFVGNPKSIMRQCGASQDDLLTLLSKKYVLGFESGIIVIKHWRMNNYLQADRHKPTTYLEEKSSLGVDKNGAYIEEKSECIQPVYNLYTQDSIGKDSIGKDSIGESNKPSRHRYGNYSNVLLTQEDYAKWHDECSKADEYIEKLSEYMASSGKSYKNHLATLRNWYRRDREKEPKEQREASYDLTDFEKRAMKKLEYKK